MVAVDQRVRFDAFEYVKGGTEKHSKKVIGTVYGVNKSHKVFHVVYCLGGVELRTSFKFCDIGEKVKVV